MLAIYCDLCGRHMPMDLGYLALTRCVEQFSSGFGNACDACASIIHQAAAEAASKLRIDPVLPDQLPAKGEEREA